MGIVSAKKTAFVCFSADIVAKFKRHFVKKLFLNPPVVNFI